MFGYFALFTVIVLLVIWLFQAMLLDVIYGATTKQQLRRAVRQIAAADAAKLDETVYEVAERYSVCVSVFRISGRTGTVTAEAHTQPYCTLHSTLLTDMTLNEIYGGAAENGLYVSTKQAPGNGGSSMLCAVLEEAGTDALLIVANAELQPLRGTVATLRIQLLLITVLLLGISALLAYYIANKMTRPVAAMNAEAKKLAGGSYGVDFDGGDFTETAELAGTLNFAAEELSKLDRLQKELIANISHDLRTPLTMISGYSEMMRDIPGENTPENIQIVIDETRHLSNLVNDMLDLSRISSGSRQPQFTVFSLTQCVRDTLERFSHLREREGYRFALDAEEEVYVEADQVLILQVLYNLICNAVNYTGEDKQITVTQRRAGEMCRISVTDTGTGIPEEQLPLIWDRYYRAGDHHKRSVAGTGLGLSIVKNALLLHGAPFGVDSHPGGTTFWFEMRVCENK